MIINLAVNIPLKQSKKFACDVEPAFIFSGGCERYFIKDLFSEKAKRFIDSCIDFGVRSESLEFSINDYCEQSWLEPDKDWIGAVISGGVLASVANNNYFQPVFPSPCLGLVPFDIPLVLDSTPQDTNIVGVGLEIIFDSKMISFLSKYNKIETSPVFIKKQVSSKWHRIKFDKFDIINKSLLISYDCKLCGTTIVGDHGLKFGFLASDFHVGEDRSGHGHLGLEKNYLISAEVARTLIKEHDFSGSIDPIIDHESKIAKSISNVLSKFL